MRVSSSNDSLPLDRMQELKERQSHMNERSKQYNSGEYSQTQKH